MITTFISAKSVSKALDKIGRLKFHKWRKSIEVLAAELNPKGGGNGYRYH